MISAVVKNVIYNRPIRVVRFTIIDLIMQSYMHRGSLFRMKLCYLLVLFQMVLVYTVIPILKDKLSW